jgi:hypothetical protein
MPSAPAPAKSLPPARRAFAPARAAPHHLARAYLQLVPGPRPARPAQAAAAARHAAAS